MLENVKYKKLTNFMKAAKIVGSKTERKI